MESPAPELSAIVLCYRAGESIHRVLGPLQEDLDISGVDYEMVLVANFDSDREDPTPDEVRAFAAGRDRVVTLIEPKQGAMGWDMRSGFDAARGEVMIVIDGDFQNPVDDVMRMYREMRRTGADVMKGRRVTRFDSLYRHFISFVYNLLFFLMYRTRGLWDINGKPKGLTREAYERLRPLRSDDWFVDAEIVIRAKRAGLTVSELPVVFRSNVERASFVRFSAIGEFLRNMVRFMWRR
jgi:glycosyltransferase involved in cell wall biosynthesis